MSRLLLMDCVGGSRAQLALLQAVDESVKESDPGRLRSLLADGALSLKALQYRSVLHRAAWLGHTSCVSLLVDHGVRADEPHRKNGCTPLHLAHFCTIDDTNPARTIRTLIDAGADINNGGSDKCGKLPIDHAIQHQRMDSVQALLEHGSLVTMQSVHIAIDVANPRILELLLLFGADCGRPLETVRFWGQPFHRILYAPLKCPRECYKQMIRLVIQATVCFPITQTRPDISNMSELTADETIPRTSSITVTAIDSELRAMARDYLDMAMYLYACLLRNGYRPTDSCRRFMGCRGAGGGSLISDWVDDYLKSPPTLRDLAIRTVRSYCCLSGNAIYGISQLHLPARIQNLLLILNPF